MIHHSQIQRNKSLTLTDTRVTAPDQFIHSRAIQWDSITNSAPWSEIFLLCSEGLAHTASTVQLSSVNLCGEAGEACLWILLPELMAQSLDPAALGLTILSVGVNDVVPFHLSVCDSCECSLTPHEYSVRVHRHPTLIPVSALPDPEPALWPPRECSLTSPTVNVLWLP